MNLSETLSRYIRETSYEQIPDNVREFTKLCILDWLGSALAGVNQPPTKIISELVSDLGGEPHASLVTGGKSSVLNAALVNGAASHVVELDDIHKSSIIHAATVVIPAAVAVAEWMNKNGKDLITAVAIGYEVCFRIGEAVSPSHYYYWHNTGTCGTFGSAAASAKLLDLSEEQIVSALGSAGTQAAGLWEFIEDGAMSKQLHPAKAAMNGVMSSLLARKGFTAASKILEGHRGFFEAFSEKYDATRITDRLGEVFKITENSFKIHASCRHTHPAVDLILKLQKEHSLSSEEVKKIKVKAYKTALVITDNPEPNTIYASKFSLQYCTALAFINRSAGLADFHEEALVDKDIRSLMKKIEVEMDPGVEATYPQKWGSIIEIEKANGEKLHYQTDYPKGDPENPVTSEDLINKFKQLTKEFSTEETDAYIHAIMDLENVTHVGQILAGTNEGNIAEKGEI